MDVSRDFFGKLRALALTLEKEARQLERGLRREDTGECRPCPVSFSGLCCSEGRRPAPELLPACPSQPQAATPRVGNAIWRVAPDHSW